MAEANEVINLATRWGDCEYVLKEPFEPTIELTRDGIIDSGVYVRRKAMPITTAPRLPANDLEPSPQDAVRKTDKCETCGDLCGFRVPGVPGSYCDPACVETYLFGENHCRWCGSTMDNPYTSVDSRLCSEDCTVNYFSRVRGDRTAALGTGKRLVLWLQAHQPETYRRLRAGSSQELRKSNIATPHVKLAVLPTVKSLPKPPSQSPPGPLYSADPAAKRARTHSMTTDGDGVISAQNTFSERNPVTGQAQRVGAGRPRKWQSNAERMATVRAEQKPLILPPLPEGVYRAREVVPAKSSWHSTARRNYHASLQENHCFFCRRVFGIFIQKHSAKPEPLRVEDEHFIPRRLPGSRKDENRHAVCHICNRLKSDLVFDTEEQCRTWLDEAWQLNGYREVGVHAIHYLGEDRSVLFEERVAA